MNISRFLFILLLLLLFSGCAVKKPPSDFLFVTPDNKDTFKSLAQAHLGNSSMAWKIQESNGIAAITPGEELIIPVKAINPGGLTAEGYQLIPVLSYHNFTQGKSKDLLTVSAKNFEKQLNFLEAVGFTPGIVARRCAGHLEDRISLASHLPAKEADLQCLTL